MAAESATRISARPGRVFHYSDTGRLASCHAPVGRVARPVTTALPGIKGGAQNAQNCARAVILRILRTTLREATPSRGVRGATTRRPRLPDAGRWNTAKVM